MSSSLQDVFVSLKAILRPYASQHGFIPSESDERFAIASATKTDRIGRPLFIAAVEVNKRYISYHLMPIYMNPALLADASPGIHSAPSQREDYSMRHLLTALLATTTIMGAAQAQEAKKVFFLLPNTSTIRFESRDAPCFVAVMKEKATACDSHAHRRNHTVSPDRERYHAVNVNVVAQHA